MRIRVCAFTTQTEYHEQRFETATTARAWLAATPHIGTNIWIDGTRANPQALQALAAQEDSSITEAEGAPP
jgi:hypothetical protein